MTELEEILNNRAQYVADGMGEYTINDKTYTGYSDYTFVWEKSYVKSPARSSNGSIGNLNSYSTFVTPRMTATYSLMTIDDYRSIMQQYLDKNEFTVTCYDPVHNLLTTNKMYFSTPNAPKFYFLANDNGGVDLIGVENFTVELIGTNNPNDN